VNKKGHISVIYHLWLHRFSVDPSSLRCKKSFFVVLFDAIYLRILWFSSCWPSPSAPSSGKVPEPVLFSWDRRFCILGGGIGIKRLRGRWINQGTGGPQGKEAATKRNRRPRSLSNESQQKPRKKELVVGKRKAFLSVDGFCLNSGGSVVMFLSRKLNQSGLFCHARTGISSACLRPVKTVALPPLSYRAPRSDFLGAEWKPDKDDDSTSITVVDNSWRPG